jgi:hypothetical protein
LSSTIKAVALGAASRTPALGLISPEVAALSEGVIKTMMLTKLRSVAVPAVLVLGLCGIAGGVVGLGREDKGSGQAATAAQNARSDPAAGQAGRLQSSDGTAALQKARAALARKGHEAAFEALRQTQKHGDILVLVGKPEEVYRWSIRWLQVERDMNPGANGHRAALEGHMKRMTELDERAKVLIEQHRILPDPAKLETEWYVLEARLWSEQARAR